MYSRKLGIAEAARSGLTATIAAPRLLAVVWLAGVLLALPIAAMVATAVASSVGKSAVGQSLEQGFDMDWHGEFAHQARGLEKSFTPSVLVGGGWLDTLDVWWSGEIFSLGPEIVAFGILFAFLWILITGGILAHFNRPGRRFSLGSFLADGGRLCLRFLRLALLSAPLYYGLFRLARWLFPWIERITVDKTVERTVLAYNLAGVAVIVALLITVKMVFDYAKIAVVVEERRSAILAVLRGFRFVLRRPLRTYGMVVLFSVLGAVLLLIYTLVAPGTGPASFAGVTLVFLLGQLFLLARLSLRLGLLAGELALFRDAL
ncbi:MAG: hypothetical protein OES47_01175 [Acidobacteriota bacterium]|nr:hypothetical protein [Acidobacteriota bacterium]